MQSLQKLAAGQDVLIPYNVLLREYGECPEKLVLRGVTPEGRVENWLPFDTLPHFRQFIFGIMARMEGQVLGEVWLEKVAPGQEGKVEAQAELVLVVVNAGHVSNILSNSSQELLAPGDVWWVRGKAGAKVENNSSSDLVLLCVEVTPWAPATYVAEPTA